MSYEIFAHHAHVFPENVRPDGTVDALLRTMDECGIARAVCFATFPSQLKAENEETNAWLAKRIRGEDRLHGFGVIDFEKGDLRGQVDRIADLGFRGIKLHPAFQKFAIDGERAFEVYAACTGTGFAIIRSGNSTKLPIISSDCASAWSISAAIASSTRGSQ